MEKEVKEVKVELKLRRQHPKKCMRLGRHMVKQNAFEEFSLNEDEMKILKSVGGVSWFMNKEDSVKTMGKKEAKAFADAARNKESQMKKKIAEAKKVADAKDKAKKDMAKQV